jgi:DNA-binding FadR family transcriptional regulator
MASQRFRQPRVAEIVASKLRDDILSGRLQEGDVLPSQERLFGEFGVSPPALREAIHILETDGLISVRRGNVGGAVIQRPTAERTAHMISMVLQARSATPVDVSEALTHLEPICAGMCAARDDRMTEVVPYLQREIDFQTAQFDDVSQYVTNARRFHETLVSRCGNEPMILLIGSLEQIWSAHESSVWGDSSDPAEPAPMVDKTRRAALRDHQRLLDAIRDGNSARAVRLAQDHLAAARHKTLAFGTDKTIEAKLMSEIGSRLDSRFRHNGRPSAASGWGYPQPRNGEGAYAQSRKESGA